MLDREWLHGILRCGVGIILSVQSLREIRILGHWPIWKKLACEDRTDGSDGTRAGRRYGRTDGSGRRIRIANIAS